MTQFEIENTMWCARAMELSNPFVEGGRILYAVPAHGLEYIEYDPLTDDARAMGLIKKFDLQLGRKYGGSIWWVWAKDGFHRTQNANLNQAIVECVANLQRNTWTLSSP